MARALDVNYFLSSPGFLKSHSELYKTSLAEEAERYSSLTEGLTGDITFFSSSGRTELIGNHTDHNNGFVLAAAVDLDTVAAVVKTDKREITVNSFGYPAFTVSLDDLAVRKNEYGMADSLVRGVLKGFSDRSYKIGGFTANTHSRIFKGAGVSSSAAFELLICEILNVLYNDGRMDFVERAIISQYAENVYFGKPSGLMDQLTASRGGVSFMDFKNTKMPKSKSVAWTFDDIALVITNCGGDHCNLTAEYTEIREDMDKVARFFGKKVLRNVSAKKFSESYDDILGGVGGRAALRAKHYFEENKRVIKAVSALEKGKKKEFLKLIGQSGYSSKEQLQNCFAKNDDWQSLMFGLKISEDIKSVKAVRVHGGGFAGTMLAMLDIGDADKYIEYMSGIFGAENLFKLSIRPKGTVQVEV